MTKHTLTAKLEQAATERPELARRIAAAAALVEKHLSNRAAAIIRGRVTLEGTIWTVKGNAGRVYIVTHVNDTWSCDCPDHTHRPSIPCKHMMAIKALCLAHDGQAAPVAAEWAPAGGWLSDRARRAPRQEWSEEC